MSSSDNSARLLIVASLAASLRNFRGALIEDFLAHGYEVHVAAPELSSDVFTRSWLEERSVRCHDLSFSRTGLSISGDLFLLLELVKLIRRICPDVFLAYTIKPVIWGVLAASLARVQQRIALVTGLGYAFVGSANGKRAAIRWLVSRLYKVALRRATLVFFQNPDDRNDFFERGILPKGSRVVLVNGSGVDTEHFSLARLPSAPIRFLLIARLLRDKGIVEYADAAARIRQKYPEAEFHLVGPLDPNPEAISEVEIAAWQRAGHLVWHGSLDDVRPAIEAAHVYVLPSYREGTPRSVLEAMSMGRAIITTDAPGCRETVRNGVNGFLVSVADPEELANAMERFLLEPQLVEQMGAHSRRIAEEKYDVRLVNAQMLEAIERS